MQYESQGSKLSQESAEIRNFSTSGLPTFGSVAIQCEPTSTRASVFQCKQMLKKLYTDQRELNPMELFFLKLFQ